jgi:hypothetical protein
VAVEDRQQGAGAAAGVAGAAAQFRPGRRGGAEHDGQEGLGRREADTEGLAGGGKLGLLVRVHDGGVREAAAQAVALDMQVGQLPAQAGEFLLVGTGVEGAEDGVGLAVDGLAGDAAALGLTADGAVGPVEDDDGAA